MKFIKTTLPEVVIIEPTIFEDERGYFFESFNQKEFEAQIGKISFVQDNESKSERGVLRGLHFQKPPFAQSKLVRCIQGRVLDVVVDIRKNSLTFGKHVAVELSGDNKRQVFIPKGFAHGFVVLSKKAIFAYKVDNWYSAVSDMGIIWDDPTINIDWQIKKEEIIVSQKDENLKPLSETDIPF